MQQLNSTGVDEMCQHSTREREAFGRCMLCLRPTERVCKSSRVIESTQLYEDILCQSMLDVNNEVLQAQIRLLREEEVVVVCFVCGPAGKKAENQRELQQKIDYPSTFLQATLSYMSEHEAPVVNRQCLIKGLLCLGTSIRLNDETLYHTLRRKERPLLEYSIAFFAFLLKETGFDVRTFSRSNEMCVFAVVVLCRWHLLGFPHAMPMRRDNKIFRRMFETDTFRLFCRMNAALDVRGMRDGCPSAARHCMCAACSAARRPRSSPADSAQGYDLAVIDRAGLWHAVCTHVSAEASYGVLQRFHCAASPGSVAFSIPSFDNYRSASAMFPPCLREENEERYYLYVLRQSPPPAATGAAGVPPP